MTSYEIIKLEDLLQSSTPVEQKTTVLTAPGENYGSLMLKVDVVVDKTEIHLVAKVPPSEKIQEHFNTQVSFRNEIAFYNQIVPILQNFRKEHGVEVMTLFPKYYGSRLNLTNNSRIDTNGCLLLENLKSAGFKNMEKTAGFDLDTSALVVSSLAEFHAVPLALKLQKPEVFNREVLPHLVPWRMDVNFHYKTKKQVEKIIDSVPEMTPLKHRILSGFDKKLQRSHCREHFATIVHNDFWVNNIMVKFDGIKPIASKIVDLQECTHASLAKDLIFFLFSSVNSQVLQKHYEDLVQIYYKKFMSTLKGLNCQIESSFDDFNKELAFEAEHSQFGHVLFMLNPIFAKGGNLDECTPEDLLYLEVTDLHKEKFSFVVREFAKRNWI